MRTPAGQTSLRTHQVSGVFHQVRPQEGNFCETLKPAEIVIKIHRKTYQQNDQTRNAHVQGTQRLISHWLLFLLRLHSYHKTVRPPATPTGQR